MPTVSTCLKSIQDLMDQKANTPFTVTGEVSSSYHDNYTALTLTEGYHELRVYIPASVMQSNSLYIEDHQIIEVKGRLSLYQGKIQIRATEFQIIRQAQTYRTQFMRITPKKSLPQVIANIAVITSITGSVYADLVNNLKYGIPELFDTTMQGPNVAIDISIQIDHINQLGGFECICIIRGGGDKKDFYGYNDEILTDAIQNSRIPVLTAIGHDVNTFNCDKAADNPKFFTTPSILATYLNEHHEEILIQPKPIINYLNILRHVTFPYKKVALSTLALYFISKYLFN